MAKTHFLGGEFQGLDDNGDPLDSGKVYFYEPGTTTLKDTYTDATLVTANANPVILDANGRAAIWLNGEYKVKLTDSSDVQIYEEDNINTGASSSASGAAQQPLNGSFEDDTDLDNVPDNWTLTPLTSATIATDSTDQAHGYNSLKFTSGGNGGGTATSNRFEVLSGSIVRIGYTYKSSSATSLNKIDLITYDKDDTPLTTHSIFSEGAANPTSYTTYYEEITADATAVNAEVRITGIDAASTTKTAGTTSNFDNIFVDNIRERALLKTKVLDIGDWNMDTTVLVTIAHGVSDWTKIRSLTALIREDLDVSVYDFASYDDQTGSTEARLTANSTNIVIARGTGGPFDGTGFDSTSFNRGWVVVQYID